MQKLIHNKKIRVLQVIGFILFLILIKVWHLSVIQIEKKQKEAQLPQRKTILVHANRGTIYDRFNVPLSLNRIKYNACIYYAHIKQIPMVRRKKDASGKRIKYYPRREHITKISKILGKELNIDPCRIEDLIHAKASLLPHVPFVIKENISEKTYYKLRMLERDQIGIHAEIKPERYYPQLSTASDILGYMGAISQNKYLSIANEIKYLEELLNKKNDLEEPILPTNYSSFEEVQNRYTALKEMSYSVNDLVGKTGLENRYDETLRGFHGKKTYEIDIKGNFLQELRCSKKNINGKKIISSISSELQNFSEMLLAKDEKIREGKSTKYSKKTKQMEKQKQPFIKGGAIVVMDPNTGEILTLASYPRCNPNDFIPSSNSTIREEKQKNILKWIENPRYIANIFDGKMNLSKELYTEKKGVYEEKVNLSLEYFLDLILPKDSEIFSALEKIKNIKNAIEIEENIEALLYHGQTGSINKIVDTIFPEDQDHILTNERLSLSEKTDILQLFKTNEDLTKKPIKNIKCYLKNIKHNKDKILVIDLLRIMVFNPAFSDDLITKIGNVSLHKYWDITKSIIAIEEKIKNTVRPIFSEHIFKSWREENQKDFLKHKREEEKAKKLYAKPYIDYLDKMNNFLFNEFWDQQKLIFITAFIKNESLADPSLSIYFEALKDLKNNIILEDKPSKWNASLSFLKSSVLHLEFDDIYNLVNTIRPFAKLERPLYGRYASILKSKANQEKELAAAFYSKNGYGYGRSEAYRQATPLGSIFKISVAYTALKKHYNHLASTGRTPDILNPLSITDIIAWDRTAKKGGSMVVGYSEDNRPYPRYYKGGRLPKSAHNNIGKIDMIAALAQSSNPYFSILSGDFLDDPEDLIMDAKNFSFGSKTQIDLPGEFSGELPKDLLTNKTGLYSFSIGQHSLVSTPLQTAVMLSAIANGGKILKPQIIKDKQEILREIFLPPSVKNTILEGLNQTVWGEKGSARVSTIKKLKFNTKATEKYNKLKHKMVGKTSTAEFMYKPDITSNKAQMYKDTWFGSIYFEKEKDWNSPKLVVVVYLKYGDGGKEAAPIAAEVIHKYIELQNKYNVSK